MGARDRHHCFFTETVLNIDFLSSKLVKCLILICICGIFVYEKLYIRFLLSDFLKSHWWILKILVGKKQSKTPLVRI
jgi:hypothetical protein